MSVANLIDSRFQVLMAFGEDLTFKKVNHLEKCGYPSAEKVMDEVTPTDANRTIKAPVDFVEESEIEFTYVYDPQDPVHTGIKKAFDDGSKVTCQIKVNGADALSVQFEALISNLTPEMEDLKKKIRINGKLTITSELTEVSG